MCLPHLSYLRMLQLCSVSLLAKRSISMKSLFLQSKVCTIIISTLFLTLGRIRAFKGEPSALADIWVETVSHSLSWRQLSWSQGAANPDVFQKVEWNGKESKRPALAIYINPTYLAKEILLSIYDQGEAYGTTDTLKGEVICIEYSSPNIAKPFHAGTYNLMIDYGWIPRSSSFHYHR